MLDPSKSTLQVPGKRENLTARCLLCPNAFLTCLWFQCAAAINNLSDILSYFSFDSKKAPEFWAQRSLGYAKTLSFWMLKYNQNTKNIWIDLCKRVLEAKIVLFHSCHELDHKMAQVLNFNLVLTQVMRVKRDRLVIALAIKITVPHVRKRNAITMMFLSKHFLKLEHFYVKKSIGINHQVLGSSGTWYSAA